MSRLIESICLRDGQFNNLLYHQQRMEYSLNELFGCTDRIDLSLFFHSHDFPKEGFYKCRVLYDHHSKVVEYIPYTFKPIASLRLIVDNSILYDHKYSDRLSINRLLNRRDGCDDILIIKDDGVTDASYANIVFKSGRKWYTPQTCLLRGTMRESLIHAGEISVEQIRSSDINKFEKFKLINAMLGFASSECDISHII